MGGVRREGIHVGDKFGNLTAVEPRGHKLYGKRLHKHAVWLFACICGKTKEVLVASVRKGSTRSCGCWVKNVRVNGLPNGEAAFNILFYTYKIGAITKGREFTLTGAEFRVLTKQDCYYCGAKPAQTVKHKKMKGNYLHNGLDRVDNRIGYVSTNVVACCSFCNKAKLNHSVEDFLSWIERVYVYSKGRGSFNR